MVVEEKEIKLDLDTEENYKRLIGHFKKITNADLHNIFFDTPNHDLMSSFWVLRLRKKDDQYLIAAKGRSHKGSLKVTVRPEIESEIDLAKAERVLKSGIIKNDLPDDILHELGNIIKDETLHPVVEFNTKRTTIAYETQSYPVKLEIDRTVYTDNSVDFELEVEIPTLEIQDQVIEQVRALLERLNIPFIFQKNSKFARALKKNDPIE